MNLEGIEQKGSEKRRKEMMQRSDEFPVTGYVELKIESGRREGICPGTDAVVR